MGAPFLRQGAMDKTIAAGFKPHTNPFVGLGMTRTFAFMGAVGMATTAIGAGSQFLEDSFNEDPNKFQRLGYGMGSLAGEATALAATGYTGYDMWRRVGAQEMARVGGKGGPMYNVMKDGGLQSVSGGKGYTAAEAKNLKNITHGQNAFSFRPRANGKWKAPGKGFVSNFGMGMNIGAMVLAPIAIGLAASATMGLAGKLLDTVRNESQKGMELTYDKRFFNTQQQDMSSYQQLGAAMQQQESRMMSVARIYHG